MKLFLKGRSLLPRKKCAFRAPRVRPRASTEGGRDRRSQGLRGAALREKQKVSKGCNGVASEGLQFPQLPFRPIGRRGRRGSPARTCFQMLELPAGQNVVYRLGFAVLSRSAGAAARGPTAHILVGTDRRVDIPVQPRQGRRGDLSAQGRLPGRNELIKMLAWDTAKGPVAFPAGSESSTAERFPGNG